MKPQTSAPSALSIFGFRVGVQALACFLQPKGCTPTQSLSPDRSLVCELVIANDYLITVSTDRLICATGRWERIHRQLVQPAIESN